MLASLKINNVALIDSLEIGFTSGLNVISGETGSGKSILLNALGFVIGDRLDKTMLRTGTEVMKVDAIFLDIPDSVSAKIQEKAGIEIENGEILISREYNINGKTSCKVNNQLVTTAILKQISSLLIDIHGQHQHQALLDREFQLCILDKFCGKPVTDKLIVLNELIDKLNEIDKKLAGLGGDQTNKQNLIDLYRYQLEEIEKAGIKETELEELSATFKEMKGAEKISGVLTENLNLLDKNAYTSSALEQIETANKNMLTITDFADKYLSLQERLNSLAIELKDLVEETENLASYLQFDEREFNRIDERIDFIKTIFRKYGGDFESLTKYKHATEEKLDILINGEQLFIELTVEKDKLIKKILDVEEAISVLRKQNALKLQKEIMLELHNLGMPKAVFEIAFEKTGELYTRSGNDLIDFMFSANLGFEPKPLNKVASGGEISRFMLAYKIVVNTIDEIDCLIFDEIDAGISGNIANVVAECMGRLSRDKQLLVVSHLPQICAMADSNLCVTKETKTAITTTKVKELKGELVYPEIARLMGLTDLEGIEYAKKLKTNATSFKNSIK